MTLTAGQFLRLRALALERLGIEIHDRQRPTLDRRACRMGLSGTAARERFLDRAESGDLDSERQLVSLVTTRHTAFFRNPYHFDLAAEHLLWAAHRRGRAAAWSAAVSTGEELWSLAIRLREMTGRRSGPVELLGSDADATALARAERGEYSGSSVEALETGRRGCFFHHPPSARGSLRIQDSLRQSVSFRIHNLVEPRWNLGGPFDVIFCRNVLMYLSRGHRRRVVERLRDALAGDGLLLLDPSEHLGAAGDHFCGGRDGVFQPAPRASNPQRIPPSP